MPDYFDTRKDIIPTLHVLIYKHVFIDIKLDFNNLIKLHFVIKLKQLFIDSFY